MDNGEDSAAVSGAFGKVQDKLLKAQQKVAAAVQAKEDSTQRAEDSVKGKIRIKTSKSSGTLFQDNIKAWLNTILRSRLPTARHA